MQVQIREPYTSVYDVWSTGKCRCHISSWPPSQAFLVLSSVTTATRNSSSLASRPRVNLTDRSSAPMRSFNVLLASLRDALKRLPLSLQSSEENDELQTVLSVHSVPQSDSRSSLTAGLEPPSPAANFVFISAVWTARSAPSMASKVLVASAVGLDSRLLSRGTGIREGGKEVRSPRGDLGRHWAALFRPAVLLRCIGGESGSAGVGEQRRKDAPGFPQKLRVISSRPLASVG